MKLMVNSFSSEQIYAKKMDVRRSHIILEKRISIEPQMTSPQL
jgi:hypothetical protein